VAGRLKTEQKKCLVYAKENGLNPQPFVRWTKAKTEKMAYNEAVE
jgi:hypothetical protein